MERLVMPKAKEKQDSRTALIEAGIVLMLEKGYSNTGVQDVLQVLNVPKGSFYHYFPSKEAFALAVIRHFHEKFAAETFAPLREHTGSPLERLRSFCESGKERVLSQQCRVGCLIGNLSQEMSSQSEVLREELASILREWIDVLAQCIQEGQALGEIKKTCSAQEFAEFFYGSWMGAVTLTKTTRTPEPLDNFIRTMFGLLKA